MCVKVEQVVKMIADPDINRALSICNLCGIWERLSFGYGFGFEFGRFLQTGNWRPRGLVFSKYV